MIDNTDLEKQTTEALRHYRKALAVVSELEYEETSARRALTNILPDSEPPILGDRAPSVKETLFRTSLAAVSRSNKAWAALSEANVTLEIARRNLIALERQLGYIPGVSIVSSHLEARDPQPNSRRV